MEDGLAGIRGVADAGRVRDAGGAAAGLMGGEAAELDRRHDGVSGGPGAIAALDPRVVAGDDEALLVGGEAVERRAEQPRDGEDPLDVEPLAAGLEHAARFPSRRATAPVLSSTPALRSSSATASLASSPNSDSARRSGVTTVTVTSSCPMSFAWPAVMSAS